MASDGQQALERVQTAAPDHVAARPRHARARRLRGRPPHPCVAARTASLHHRGDGLGAGRPTAERTLAAGFDGAPREARRGARHRRRAGRQRPTPEPLRRELKLLPSGSGGGAKACLVEHPAGAREALTGAASRAARYCQSGPPRRAPRRPRHGDRMDSLLAAPTHRWRRRALDLAAILGAVARLVLLWRFRDASVGTARAAGG